MNRKWESIKQEYLFAETFEERRVLALIAANVAWAMSGGKGRFPTKEFFDEFLEPFFQYEKHRLQRMKLQHITQKIAKEEELVHAEGEMYWSKKCIERLEKQSGKR